MVDRRTFIAGAAAFAAAPAFASRIDEIRAVLLHWGVNMWGESLPEGISTIAKGRLCRTKVEFDESRWNALVEHAALRRVNMIVIDLGEFPVWPSHPTLDNFSDLFVTMGKSFVPFSRYLMNTIFITVVGTFGHLVVAGMAAFVLAKYDFPGNRLFFGLVTTCLMFSGYVTGIPNYLIMSNLGMVDTYWSLILPAFCAPIGMFLMKQFMDGLPTALIEAATIDGASRFKVFWSIVMPNVKPAWLTMIIFSVQGLWNNPATTLIYSEAKKPLVYALNQIQGQAVTNIARTGEVAAANMIIFIVPILIFIFSQSRILETMASSGIKD